MTKTAHTPRVLVVDDNNTARLFLQASLERHGLVVTTAENAESAEAELADGGLRRFDCIVTDLWMPGRSGIDLLRTVHQRDPHLSMLIVSGAGERETIAESLRHGATDFLDKPVAAAKLREAVDRAVAATRDARRQAQTVSAVRDVGRLQQMMLMPARQDQAPPIDLRFFPNSEAGGDSLNFFRMGPACDFVLLTDVSGHDLRAAFISAYFQGVVRGLLDQRVPVPCVFSYFNNLLLNEWSAGPGSQLQGITASVAVCSLLLHYQQQEVTVFNSGAPLPVHVNSEGVAETVGVEGSYPLGWFEGQPLRSSQHSIAAGGSFFLWSDGLEHLAQVREVSPPALATSLLLQPNPDRPTDAQDDVLVARVGLEHKYVHGERFFPILCETYPGDSAGEIDQYQKQWQASLRYAIPDLSEETLYAILLASREALLNALNHGCHRDAELRGRLSITYAPALRLVRVTISDPGEGHDFPAIHETAAVEGDDLLPAHRGLFLMRELATSVSLLWRGAEVRMDFQLNTKPCQS